jgi:hypothetical protein
MLAPDKTEPSDHPSAILKEHTLSPPPPPIGTPYLIVGTSGPQSHCGRDDRAAKIGPRLGI